MSMVFFKQNKNLLGIKISLYAVLVALIAITTAFILVESRHFKLEVQAHKDIDTLYLQIGLLTQEKDDIITRFIETQSHLKTIYTSLSELSKDLNKVNIQRETLEEALKGAQSKLAEQNKSISTLMQENLKSVKPVMPKSDGIMDILIVGLNGSLSDTIMLVRLIEDQKKVVLISIPRDLYYESRKINEIYTYKGIDKLKEAVFNITGIVPEKYLIVNLQSFLKVYDILFPNGVKVTVEEDIYDNAYPTWNKGYSIFSLKKGEQVLNADTTLKYIRTRHGDSDFKRSARQQNFIKSAINELKSQDFFTHIDQTIEMVSNINNLITTNIGVFEGLQYFNDYKNFNLSINNVLDNQEKEFIKTDGETFKGRLFTSSMNVKGQYVLIPVNGEFSSVWEYVLS